MQGARKHAQKDELLDAHDGWDEGDEEGSFAEEEEDPEPQDPDAPQAEFYDPDLDARDEAWVARQRGGRKSDAILSCPGCLTTICLDCQQHSAKEGQFRAMFCMNVRVDKGRTVPSKAVGQRRGKRRRGKEEAAAEQGAGTKPEQVFHPVECSLCDAHLGVQDAEEVFHLYHVVASNA